jgi:hypothetical protein
MARYAFGIDLAGYTTGRTVVAAMMRDEDSTRVWLLRNSPLSEAYRSDAPLPGIVSAECEALRAMSRLGPVAIDVPIDLQKVGGAESAVIIWQLYKRPVDQAFKAMPALADRIGAPYARMQAILAYCGHALRLGQELFETYPKASLQMLSLPWRGYKGVEARHHQARMLLCDRLKWGQCATDDEFDALLCAAAAGASAEERISGSSLRSLIASLLPGCPDCEPPLGYILLRRPPPPIETVEEADFGDWIEARR